MQVTCEGVEYPFCKPGPITRRRDAGSAEKEVRQYIGNDLENPTAAKEQPASLHVTDE
jgi:hypothetical protein